MSVDLPGASMPAMHKRAFNLAAALVILCLAAIWIERLRDVWGASVPFDDAYMFARYAANMRHSLGFSWNLDGVHTYGQTSLIWAWIVLGVSYLPMKISDALMLSSWVSSVGAVLAMSWTVALNARSEMMRSFWRVLPLVALPLVFVKAFYKHALTGMETMLAATFCAVFLGLALAWQGGRVRPEVVGLTGLLIYMTRPEAAIVVVVLPVTIFWLMPGVTFRGLSVVLGVFAAGVVMELVGCKLYFHTALPLAFYMKSQHGYEGYSGKWYPELVMLVFLAACQAYLIAMVLFGRKRDWRLVACCLIPALAAFVYLLTVEQIMGYNARYYAPYFAFLVVPGLLIVDRWLWNDGKSRIIRWSWPVFAGRVLCALLLVAFFMAMKVGRVRLQVALMEPARSVYDPVELTVGAQAPLPKTEWVTTAEDVTNLLVAPLPKGATVAASEVGYLGARAPQVNVIDLAGLNDNDIALRGFQMDALLARKPDMIWLPHTDYTYQRGLMLRDPRLLRQYDVYAGAALYGYALRKDSPYRALIDRQFQVFWKELYPEYTMSDYKVQSTHWTAQKHRYVQPRLVRP